MTILVTGGAGFIGSNFVIEWLLKNKESVINLDKLTYAGNISNLDGLKNSPNHIFVHGDIGDSKLTNRLLNEYQPRCIINFAAESHVDRSIHGPEEFIQTNIVSTFHLLESARKYWDNLKSKKKTIFVFFMFPQMRCMDHLNIKLRLSQKSIVISQIVHIQRAKRHLII